MLALVTLIIVPVVALVAIILSLVWIANRMADRLVGRKHRWLEEILSTGEPPAVWQTPYARRMARLQAGPGQAAQKQQIQAAAQAAHLRRLDELTRYITTSPLVSDEETRETLLAQLVGVREAWSARGLDHLT